MVAEAAVAARHHRYLKWFWVANLPVCIGLYAWAPQTVTLLYLAVVSVYANIVSHAGAEQACEAREAAEAS